MYEFKMAYLLKFLKFKDSKKNGPLINQEKYVYCKNHLCINKHVYTYRCVLI